MITIEEHKGQFSVNAAGIRLQNMEFQISLRDRILRSGESICTGQPEKNISDETLGEGRLL
ncbi:hypothetical protein AGMMS50255_6080 [Spirochaetia bacterium]|nr:hypothetical protein AGMMS50255_6080 [Spirochaetia bacterium]